MFTVDEEVLRSERLDGYLHVAAWAVVLASLTCLYLLYCYYLSLISTASPLRYLSMRVLLAILGASGAVGGTFLSKAMWVYWSQIDKSSSSFRRSWFFIMTLIPVLGPTAYYFCAYKVLYGEPASGGTEEGRSERFSRFKFACGFVIILLVFAFSVFPGRLLRWLPVSAWMTIFLVGVTAFAIVGIALRYRRRRS
jgi:hypothetical protein